MKPLTKREEEGMQVFWKNGELYIKDIISLLGQPKSHYNTVLTFVRILDKKTFVNHKQFGNTYQYFAIITQEEYCVSIINEVVNNYLDKSFISLFSILLERGKITIKDFHNLMIDIK